MKPTEALKCPHAVFDLDDVIGGFNVELCKHLSTVTGKNCNDDWMTWDQYEIDHLYPQITDFHQVFLDMEANGAIGSIKPLAPAMSLMRQMVEDGWYITILTARGWMSDSEGVTRKWLVDNNVPFDDLIVSPYRVSKSELIPRGADLYFDDNAQHIVDCAPHVVRAVLIDKPWNRFLVDLPLNVIRVSGEDLATFNYKETHEEV